MYPDYLFELVYELFDGVFPNSLIGIKNIETGEIDYKFNCGIYDYHPNEGYVILQKHCDRDYACGDRHFIILSLRTGKELEGLFVDHISGIENLKFHSVRYNSPIDYPAVYKIDELHQKIDELDYVSEEELALFLNPNYNKNNEYVIEEKYSNDFYQDDESFIGYIKRKAQL